MGDAKVKGEGGDITLIDHSVMGIPVMARIEVPAGTMKHITINAKGSKVAALINITDEKAQYVN